MRTGKNFARLPSKRILGKRILSEEILGEEILYEAFRNLILENSAKSASHTCLLKLIFTI